MDQHAPEDVGIAPARASGGRVGAPTTTRRRTAVLWAVGVAGSLLVAIAATLAVIDWNRLRGPVARYAARVVHRDVTIGGPLNVHLWTLSPRVEVRGLTIGGAPWDPPRPLLTVEELDVQLSLLPLLVGHLDFDFIRAIHPQVFLHRAADGRVNWAGSNPPPRTAAAARFKLPPIRSLDIKDGHLDLLDDERRLALSTSLVASEEPANAEGYALHVAGRGELNGRPLTVDLHGEPLTTSSAGGPYKFEVAVQAADIHANATGRAAKVFDFGQLTASAQLAGADLAELYYLTGLALPNTPAYKINVNLQRKGTRVALDDIAGNVGGSDVNGALTVDLSGKRPKLSGTIASRQLRFADLAAPLGVVKPGADRHPVVAARAPVESTAPFASRLLPDASLQVNRIRGMDADVQYSAQSVQTEKTALRKVSAHIKLQDGVLTLDPVLFAFADGAVNLTARVDGRKDMPQTTLDLQAKDVRLEQFGKPGTPPLLVGTLHARARLSGPGRSIHELATNGRGTVSLAVPHGEIREALAELTGINVDRGLGLLLFNGKQKSELRCGVANFEVEHGDMTARTFVVDTGTVRINGTGNVELGSEALNLDLKGEPKKLRLVRLRSPVLIRGTLAKPVVRVDVSKSGAQLGTAVALSSVLSPVAAIIALVDSGRAKDVDCAALLASAGTDAAGGRQAATAERGPAGSP